MHIKYYHKDLTALMGTTPKVLDLAYARAAPEPEVEAKPHKPKVSKSKRVENEPKIRDTSTDKQMDVEFDEIVKSFDSPESRIPSVGKRKRPRVLLPVRDAIEPAVEAPAVGDTDSDSAFREEFEKKFGANQPKIEELDFEAAISAHTVCKVDKKKVDRKPKVLPKARASNASEDDFGSDMESAWSLPRSGTPDSKMLIDNSMQESGPEQKEGELYYTSESM